MGARGAMGPLPPEQCLAAWACMHIISGEDEWAHDGTLLLRRQMALCTHG